MYTNRAGIALDVGTRLAFQFIVVQGLKFLFLPHHNTWMPCNVISCHYLRMCEGIGYFVRLLFSQNETLVLGDLSLLW